MSCFCCKNIYKVCLPICASEPAVIDLPFLASETKIYVLHLEYLGGVKEVMQLQTINTNIKFIMLASELNEDYCYNAKIFDILGNSITFGNTNEYDCLNICTKLDL